MKVIVADDYESMSERAFEIMKDEVVRNPNSVLGLATGTTPLGLYRLMVDDHKRNGTDYGSVKTVNLDEYMGLSSADRQSYARFMRENLFDGLNIARENTYIENGMASDAESECLRYNEILDGLNIDIQLLGLGSNGHIAFNEPGTQFGTETHVVKLADSTVKDNSRLFDSTESVPTHAFTMGIKNIMQAKKVLVLASGSNKAKAVYGAVRGEVTEELPASVLQLHPDCTLIADRAAAALL